MLTDELRELEERLLLVDVRASSEELDRLLDDDFVEFGSSGRTYTRSEAISALVEDPSITVEGALEDFRMKLLARDVALVTYRLGTFLRSSIWRKGAAGWRVVFHQGTPTR